MVIQGYFKACAGELNKKNTKGFTFFYIQFNYSFYYKYDSDMLIIPCLDENLTQLK